MKLWCKKRQSPHMKAQDSTQLGQAAEPEPLPHIWCIQGLCSSEWHLSCTLWCGAVGGGATVLCYFELWSNCQSGAFWQIFGELWGRIHPPKKQNRDALDRWEPCCITLTKYTSTSWDFSFRSSFVEVNTASLLLVVGNVSRQPRSYNGLNIYLLSFF